MRILGLILNFVLFFQSVAFAGEFDCEDKTIQVSIIEADIQKYFEKNGNPYESFINKANLQKQLVALKSIEPKVEKIEDLSSEANVDKVDYSILSQLPGACEEYEKDQEDIEAKKKCDETLFKYLTDEAFSVALEENINEAIKLESDAIVQLQNNQHFKALKNLKQYLALEVLERCELEEGERSKILNIACDKNLVGVPKDDLEKHVLDNLAIVTELNKELNKVDLATIERSCAMLTGVGLATDKGLERTFTDKDGKQIDFGYSDTEFAICEDVLAEQKIRVKEEVKIAQKEKRKREREERRQKRREKNKTIIVKKDYKTSDKDFISDATNGDKDKKSKKKKRKRRKSGGFWKTAGLVTAAVGASGLLAYGLYKVFEPVGTSPYVAPVNTYTNPRTFTSYSMNPYEQYQLQKYMMGGYQMSPNWIGYTPDASNSPYTFEFNQ